MVVTRQRPLKKSGPTGYASDRWGIWQERECEFCAAKDGRWMPCVTAGSQYEAVEMSQLKSLNT